MSDPAHDRRRQSDPAPTEPPTRELTMKPLLNGLTVLAVLGCATWAVLADQIGPYVWAAVVVLVAAIGMGAGKPERPAVPGLEGPPGPQGPPGPMGMAGSQRFIPHTHIHVQSGDPGQSGQATEHE